MIGKYLKLVLGLIVLSAQTAAAPPPEETLSSPAASVTPSHLLNKADVDAWLDGRHVVADWRPPSGTRYPGQQWLTMKSGLYTGVDEGSEPPTQRRFVSIQPLACDITRANPATTAATSPASPDATTESGSAS